MSMADTARLSALERRCTELEARCTALEAAQDALDADAATPAARRAMCPKCGEKPAYHFHVQHCQGKKKAA